MASLGNSCWIKWVFGLILQNFSDVLPYHVSKQKATIFSDVILGVGEVVLSGIVVRISAPGSNSYYTMKLLCDLGPLTTFELASQS